MLGDPAGEHLTPRSECNGAAEETGGDTASCAVGREMSRCLSPFKTRGGKCDANQLAAAMSGALIDGVVESDTAPPVSHRRHNWRRRLSPTHRSVLLTKPAAAQASNQLPSRREGWPGCYCTVYTRTWSGWLLIVGSGHLHVRVAKQTHMASAAL